MKFRILQLLIIGLLAGCVCLPPKAHAQISSMCSYKPVTTPLTGTECWPVNQNGVTKTLKASQLTEQAVNGPTTSVIGDVALWNNTTGTLLKDGGPLPAISPKTFGAVGDCTTDDAAALQAAINAAVLLASQYPTEPTTGGNHVAVDLGGSCLALGSNVTLGNANGLVLQNGKIVPANGFTGTLVTASGGYNTIQGIYCDGGRTADCFDASSNTFAFHLLNNQWLHTPNFGAKVSMSGAVINGNLGTQWIQTDPEFSIQADYTARVLWVLDNDGMVTNNIMHNGLYPLQCGDDATSRHCGTIQFVGNHFYNGTVSDPGLTNAVAVKIDSPSGNASGELEFTNTYLDNGSFQSESSSVAFSGSLILNAQPWNPLFAWFRFIPTSNNQPMGSIHFYGPITASGAAATGTPLFEFGSDCSVVAPTTPCWAAPSTTLSAKSISSATYNSSTGEVVLTVNVATNYTSGSLIDVNNLTGTGDFAQAQGRFTATNGTSGTILHYLVPTGLTMTITGGSVGPTPSDYQIGNGATSVVTFGTTQTVSRHFLTNNVVNNIGIAANFAGVKESTVGQNGFNNLVLSTNGNPGLVIGPDQSVRFPGSGSLTCASGCGTGAIVSGSNTLGRVVLGTSPSSPITINFSPAWKTSSGSDVNPTCFVQEQNGLADVQSFIPSNTQLQISLASPTGSRTISWFCSFTASQ